MPGIGWRSAVVPSTIQRCSPAPPRRSSPSRPDLAPRGFLARLGEQRGFVATTDSLGDFVGVILARRVAAAVAEAETFETFLIARCGDGLDRRPLVVARRQIEADRPAAAAAILAVALPKRRHLLLLRLVALEGPGTH